MKKKNKNSPDYSRKNIKKKPMKVSENGIRAPSKRSRTARSRTLTGLKDWSWEALAKSDCLRPIRTEKEYEDAYNVAATMAATRDLDHSQTSYLEALTLLLAEWEKKHHPKIDLSHITALDSLEFLLEENGMNASDLGHLLGDRSLGSKILRGERELSKKHIKILAARFHVEPGLFL